VENLSQSQFGPFHIDVRERVLRRDGQPVPLTPKAFDVLLALVEQPGRLLSKQELLDKVWPDTFVEESNLAYNVFALRKALGDPADRGQYIETVPRRGYRFSAPMTPVNESNGERPLTAGAAEPLISDAEVRAAQSRYQTMAELSVVADDGDPASSDVARGCVPAGSSAWRPTAWVALVAVLAAGSLVVYRWRITSSLAEPLRAVPLTSMPGVVRSPSLSPDGHHVVFTWTGTSQANPDVYVQQVGAGPPLQLTKDPANDYSPSWSPDGRTIAFLRRGPDSTSSEVLLIAPLGGPERMVGRIQPRVAFNPPSLSWCPDSACLVVSDAAGDGGTDAVFVIFLESGERRQLTYPQKGLDADPAISPDGRALIFRRDSTPFSGEFYRLSLKDQMMPDGEPVRLTSTLSGGKPAWMPDGREFLFAARGALWRLDGVNGGAPMRLPFVGQDGQTPVVSRTADGRQRLVYVRSFADGNIWRVDTASAGAPAASAPVMAIASTRFDGIPSLSPDALRVAFMSNRSGESEIWVSSPDGSNAVPVTALRVLPGFPRWSPDGQLIAFHGDPRARPEVLEVPARGGKPNILETDTLTSAYPSFSRDGRWIYFCGGQAGRFRIWKMPASGGAAVQVTNNAGSIAIESYDGRDLYYVSATDRPSSLWRLHLAGGAPLKVLDGIVLGNFDVVESGIYYIDRVSGEAGEYFTDRPSGETRLQYFDFATGRSTTVARNLGTVSLGLSASRDGRTVYFSRVDSAVDELMLVDNFR
jgi:Tol biopolymer transport system component/DNA-binding winged helix-turn-helix (wHTH) protein